MYLILVQLIITYDIVGWGDVFDNVLTELQICQNQILKVFFNKTLRCSIETFYKVLKLLTIKKLYYKTIVIFKKKYCMLNFIAHGINMRYAKNNCSINWSNKIR